MYDMDMSKLNLQTDFYIGTQNSDQKETQINSKNDININNRRISQNSDNSPLNKKINNVKKTKPIRIPEMRIETNILSILNGRPLERNTQNKSTSFTDKIERLKEKNIFSANTRKNYKSFDRSVSSKNNSPVINQNQVSNKNNRDSNFLIKYSQSQFAENFKQPKTYKNFSALRNIETEGFICSKNRLGSSLKNFGNINTTDTINTNNSNTNINYLLNINNFNNNEIKDSGIIHNLKMKSIEYEKTKSITHNKTYYRTITSNNGTSKKNTLNSPEDTRFTKFQEKLMSHFNSLKRQKITRVTTKENFIVKNTITNNIICKKQNSKKKNPANSEKVGKINYINNILYNANLTNNCVNLDKRSSEYASNNKNKDKSIKNSCASLKINLESDKNFKKNFECNNVSTNLIKNQNSVDIRENNSRKNNNEKLNDLLSEQYKFSIENSPNTQRENKCSKSVLNKKNNDLNVERSLIRFGFDELKEDTMSLSIGERLYHKSVAMKSGKEKRASIELYKNNIKTLSSFSFMPKLCKNSLRLNIKVIYNFFNVYNYISFI